MSAKEVHRVKNIEYASGDANATLTLSGTVPSYVFHTLEFAANSR